MAAAAEQHVPAWKRLGLTLKHAKDLPEPAQSPVAASPASSNKKSKRSHDDLKPSHDTKKRKIGNTSDVSTPVKDQTHSRLSPEKQIPSSIKKSPTKSSNRPKSVSFSQDTKTEDGDTGMNAFRDWVAQQNALEIEAEEAAARERANQSSDPPKQQAPKADSTTEDSVASTKTSEKPAKVKKPKVEKSKPTAPIEPNQKKVKVRTPKTGDRPVPEYVRYLEQHHNDRASWKFNKSKQNDLLKNVWSIYRVPSELNDALVDYIAGLQGAARQRLQDSARTLITEIVQFIRKEIPEVKQDPMDTLEARKAALETAEKQEKGEDRAQTLRQKQQEDERATKLLKAIIGEAMNATSASKPASEPEPETARSRKKKRRSRTTTSDSESSSDDSDSDSDSDSAARRPSKKTKTAKKTSTTDSSSSDSSDTSSSESDSDSDSDSENHSSDDDDSSESDSSADDSSSSESDDGSSDSDSD